jgi:predicted murein hydrolase (TIGR00659 family)
MIQEFLSSQLFLLMLTVALYSGGMAIYKRTRSSLLHPVILTFGVLIIFLSLFNIPYSTYREATQILDFGLGMSVVALGYLLYEQEERMKGHVIEILTAVGVGSVVGVLSVVYIAKWFGADRLIQDSIAMKSVTVPIAVGISERIGGDVSISSVVVFVVGIFGAVTGFALLRLLIKDPEAKGLARGSAAHGIGTARSIEEGAVEGALSGLAIALMGAITALVAPVLSRFLY